MRAQATAAKPEVPTAPYGYTYASIWPLGDDKGSLIRTYHYVMPHHQIRAIQEFTDDGSMAKFKIVGQIWVPMDDENYMVWNWYYSFDNPLDNQERDESFWGNSPTFIDEQNGFRTYLNKGND